MSMLKKIIFSFAIMFLVVSLASAVSLLTVPQGGTGWGNFQSGTLLTGNGTGRLATTTVGSGLTLAGGVLTATGGAFAWTPTSYGVSTTTTLGFLNGFLSTASSTFTSSTNFHSGIWNSSGSVGIGTTSPYQILSIDGGDVIIRDSTPTVRMQPTSDTQSSRIWFLNTAGTEKGGFIYDNTTDSLGLRTNGISGGNDLTINSSGNVGIGTTTPNAKLNVLGSSGTQYSNSIAKFYAAATQGVYIGYNTTDKYGYIGAITEGVTHDSLVLEPSGGNVGIGTTTPTELLSIQGGASTRIQLTSSSGYNYNSTIENNYNAANPLNIKWSTINVLTVENSAYQVYLGASGNTAGTGVGLRVAGSLKLFANLAGDVGIGTASTTQYARLDVAGANNGTLPLLQLASVAGGATTTQFIVTNAGNVGIGTTNPGEKLQVAGAIRATGALTAWTANSSSLSQEAAGTYIASAGSAVGTRGAINFYITGSAGGSALIAMKVANTGFVGIGTTSPYAPLSVVGETVSAYFTATTTSNNTFPNLLSTNATSTGTMTIPVGASVITPIAGNFAIDTTSGQLRYSDVTGTTRVLVPYYPMGFTFSSSTPGTGTTTRYLTPARSALTVTKVRCDSNTFYDVSLYDGTNRANLVKASSTIGTFTYTTNNTFTANEAMRVDVGTTTAPTGTAYLSCGFDYDYTVD